MASCVPYRPTGKAIGKAPLKMSVMLFNGLKMNPMNSLGPPKEKVLQIRFKWHSFLTTIEHTNISENLTNLITT